MVASKRSRPAVEPSPARPDRVVSPQTYTPKHLADKILTSLAALDGERKIVTVMFADEAGFTAISERRYIDTCTLMVEALGEIPGLRIVVEHDPVNRVIPHAVVYFTPDWVGRHRATPSRWRWPRASRTSMSSRAPTRTATSTRSRSIRSTCSLATPRSSPRGYSRRAVSELTEILTADVHGTARRCSKILHRQSR